MNEEDYIPDTKAASAIHEIEMEGGVEGEGGMFQVPQLAPNNGEIVYMFETNVYVDYFNDMLKCWEPCLDPIIAELVIGQVCLYCTYYN